MKEKLNYLKQILNEEDDPYYPKSKAIIKKILSDNPLLNSSTADICSLVDLCLVLTEYPPRLIKKGTANQEGTQFKAAISCILENDDIKIVFNETNISLVNITPNGFQHKEITHKRETQGNRTWIFKNMKFKSTENKRASKGTIFEKSLILFQINFSIQTSRLFISCNKSLHSEPVVVIVHSSQEPEAHLALFIDDYYRIDRLSFIEGRGFPHLETTNCVELTSNISNYFKKETGRPLTRANYDYLLNKAKKHFVTEFVEINNFIKVQMNNSKISFGLWIILLVRMCKNENVNKLWLNSFIEGFISKDVRHLLNETGSFLLRFSEKSAAIGVVMKVNNDIINLWKPFTDLECRKMNLANALCDFPSLRIIRKADGRFIPKSEALSRFVDINNISDGYTARGESGIESSPMMDDIDGMLDLPVLNQNEDFDIDGLLATCADLLNENPQTDFIN